LRVGVSAISNREDDAFINRSRHRCTRRNLLAGQFSQAATRVAPLRQQVGSLAAQVRRRANTIISWVLPASFWQAGGGSGWRVSTSII
jgi:hypothetical protein